MQDRATGSFEPLKKGEKTLKDCSEKPLQSQNQVKTPSFVKRLSQCIWTFWKIFVYLRQLQDPKDQQQHERGDVGFCLSL